MRADWSGGGHRRPTVRWRAASKMLGAGQDRMPLGKPGGGGTSSTDRGEGRGGEGAVFGGVVDELLGKIPISKGPNGRPVCAALALTGSYAVKGNFA